MYSPFKGGLVTTKNLLKNLYKNKCRMLQFEKPMLVYEEYFNTDVSLYISYITRSLFAIRSPATGFCIGIPCYEQCARLY